MEVQLLAYKPKNTKMVVLSKEIKDKARVKFSNHFTKPLQLNAFIWDTNFCLLGSELQGLSF